MTAYRFRRWCEWVWIITAPLSFLFILMGILAELDALSCIGLAFAVVFLVAICIHGYMWIQMIGESPNSSRDMDSIVAEKLRKYGLSEEEIQKYFRDIRNRDINQ